MNKRRQRGTGHRRGPAGRRRWHFDREGVMCLVGALICLAIGAFQAQDLYLLRHRGEVVDALVLDETGGRHSQITVRYTTRAGEQVTADTSNYVEANRGETIQVVYDPREPRRMQAADWGFDYVPPGIFGVGAAALLAFGVANLRS